MYILQKLYAGLYILWYTHVRPLMSTWSLLKLQREFCQLQPLTAMPASPGICSSASFATS